MTPLEAAQLLNLPPGAGREPIEERYRALRSDLETRIAGAGTAGLKSRYEQALADTTAAYEALVLADDAASIPALRERDIGSVADPAPPFLPEAAKRPAPGFVRRTVGVVGTLLLAGVTAIAGILAFLTLSSFADGTIYKFPEPQEDPGVTLFIGGVGLILLPPILVLLRASRRSQGQVFPAKQALGVWGLTLAAFAGSWGYFVAQRDQRPVPVQAAVTQAPVSAPAPVRVAAPVAAPVAAIPPAPDVPKGPVTADDFYMEGIRFASGSGRPADPAKAIESYLKAAEQGDARAMFALSEAYADGIDGTKRPEEAKRWEERWTAARAAGELKELTAKAEQGDNEARTQLGVQYWAGTGVARDRAKALEFWRQAAVAGGAEAMWNLGRALEAGEGVVAPDPVQAREWIRKAAALGLPAATARVAELDAAEVRDRAAVAAAEARFAKMGNQGQLVSLAPGFAGWQGRKLQAPRGYEMLQASDVYLGMPWGRRRVGDTLVDDPDRPWVGTYRMVPAANLRQAHIDSATNSTTSLFSNFEDTRTLRQAKGLMTRASDLTGSVSLGWVVFVYVHDFGTASPDSMNIGYGVVAGNASLDEGIVEAFKLAQDGFRKRGGQVMQLAHIRAGVSARIDFEQLRRDNLYTFDFLMPFQFEFHMPSDGDEANAYGLNLRLPEDPAAFLQFVKNFRTGEYPGRGGTRWYGRVENKHPPRSGMVGPVFAEEQIQRPAATPAFRSWVAALQVSGVVGGANPGVMTAAGMHRAGSIVDQARGIRLLEFNPQTRVAVFEDAAKAVAARKF